MDTAKLFPIVLIINIYHALWLFIGMLKFPPMILSLIIYGVAMNSARQRGRFLLLVPIAYILDILGIIYIGYWMTVPLLILPSFLILIILQIYLIRLTKYELTIFDRTIQSMNEKDRKLARNALDTKNVDDVAKVAEYTNWRSL